MKKEKFIYVRFFLIDTCESYKLLIFFKMKLKRKLL